MVVGFEAEAGRSLRKKRCKNLMFSRTLHLCVSTFFEPENIPYKKTGHQMRSCNLHTYTWRKYIYYISRLFIDIYVLHICSIGTHVEISICIFTESRTYIPTPISQKTIPGVMNFCFGISIYKQKIFTNSFGAKGAIMHWKFFIQTNFCL